MSRDEGQTARRETMGGDEAGGVALLCLGSELLYVLRDRLSAQKVPPPRAARGKQETNAKKKKGGTRTKGRKNGSERQTP